MRPTPRSMTGGYPSRSYVTPDPPRAATLATDRRGRVTSRAVSTGASRPPPPPGRPATTPGTRGGTGTAAAAAAAVLDDATTAAAAAGRDHAGHGARLASRDHAGHGARAQSRDDARRGCPCPEADSRAPGCACPRAPQGRPSHGRRGASGRGPRARPARRPGHGARRAPVPPRHRGPIRLDSVPEPVAIRSPLVGRDDTLAALDDVIARAIDFQAPQLVTIVGNQGTGKTRLMSELVARAAANEARSCRVFHGRAERDAAQQPVKLAAITTLLRDRFELTPDPDEVARLRFSHEVRTVMGTEVAEALCFLGGFVGLPYPPTPFLRAIEDNAKLSAELARAVLRRFLELDAGNGPLVLVLDDMQWARSRDARARDRADHGPRRLARGADRGRAARDARPHDRVGRGRHRSRADRSAQPRGRRRRADVPGTSCRACATSPRTRRRPRSR